MSKNAPGRVATEENQPFARPSGGRPAARSFAATRAVAAAVSGDEPLVPPTVCSDASVTTGHPGEMSASALTSGRVRAVSGVDLLRRVDRLVGEQRGGA